jgi:hypothetical protein
MLHGAFQWKATIHIYHHENFQKIEKYFALTVACPKIQKAILTALVL